MDALYAFYLESNDGAVFYIDNKMIIDKGKPHRAQESFGKVGLQKGFHTLKRTISKWKMLKILFLNGKVLESKNKKYPKKFYFIKNLITDIQ